MPNIFTLWPIEFFSAGFIESLQVIAPMLRSSFTMAVITQAIHTILVATIIELGVLNLGAGQYYSIQSINTLVYYIVDYVATKH